MLVLVKRHPPIHHDRLVTADISVTKICYYTGKYHHERATCYFRLYMISELSCSEFRSSGWLNPGSMSCEGYVGRNSSVCFCQHSWSQYHYHMTCGHWHGRPLAFRVTADDSQFSFFDIFLSVFYQ